MRINVPSTGHVGPSQLTGSPNTFDPYTNATYVGILGQAVSLLTQNILLRPWVSVPCNAVFQGHPNGKSFSDLWVDPDFWINFNANPAPDLYGVTRMGTKEITIGVFPFTRPNAVRVVAATIVHEMGHVNGAPGWPSAQAESSLPFCGFSDVWDPTILGEVSRGSGTSRFA
jgi:hypothetical protein